MSENSYEEAIELIKKHNLDPLPIKRPSVGDLTRLEHRLGVCLPNSYNVVFATETSRKERLITDTMIEIGVAGYGPFFFIDCAELDENGEAPVYEAPANGVQNGKDKLADSFGEFLLNEVRSITGDAPD